jgi:hypothetical protein
MWLPLLALVVPLCTAAKAAESALPPSSPPRVLIVGSAEVAGQAEEPLAWVSADARAWSVAARAFTDADRITLLAGAVTSAAVLEATSAINEANTASPADLIVVWLGRGRRAGATMELALADRWVAADKLGDRLAALGAVNVTLIVDADHALRWLWPQTPTSRFLPSEALAPPTLGGRAVTALIETRRRVEQARLTGSALSLRTRSCLLGLGDIDGDGKLMSQELTRCVNAMPPTEASVPLAIPSPNRVVADLSEITPAALVRGALGHRVSLADGELLALGRAGAGHAGAWRLPADVPRVVEELRLDDEVATVTPAERRVLSAVSDEVTRGPGLPKDLWGMSADEEASLDLRLRLAGYFESEDGAGESTLWLAGGVTAGAIGLGLLVAELALVGPEAFNLVQEGIRPVVLAGGALLVFGGALIAGALIAPFFTDDPAPASAPPPGRKRRRAIGAAMQQLRDDAASDGQWRVVGAIAAGGAAAVAGVGAAGLTGALLLGAVGTDEDSRRLLSLGAGGAAGLAVALGAVAAILPLGAGRSARVLGALDLQAPPSSTDTPQAQSGSRAGSAAVSAE